MGWGGSAGCRRQRRQAVRDIGKKVGLRTRVSRADARTRALPRLRIRARAPRRTRPGRARRRFEPVDRAALLLVATTRIRRLDVHALLAHAPNGDPCRAVELGSERSLVAM